MVYKQQFINFIISIEIMLYMNYTVFISHLKSVSNISFSKQLLDECFTKHFTNKSKIHTKLNICSTMFLRRDLTGVPVGSGALLTQSSQQPA